MAPHSEAGVSADLDNMSISPFGEARSTVGGKPLNDDEVRKMTEYFNATLYLCLGMIYLKENPLLREPLELAHFKRRLLGHWGSDAGQVRTFNSAKARASVSVE